MLIFRHFEHFKSVFAHHYCFRSSKITPMLHQNCINLVVSIVDVWLNNIEEKEPYFEDNVQ